MVPGMCGQLIGTVSAAAMLADADSMPLQMPILQDPPAPLSRAICALQAVAHIRYMARGKAHMSTQCCATTWLSSTAAFTADTLTKLCTPHHKHFGGTTPLVSHLQRLSINTAVKPIDQPQSLLPQPLPLDARQPGTADPTQLSARVPLTVSCACIADGVLLASGCKHLKRRGSKPVASSAAPGRWPCSPSCCT
jgi:hypothetical protein